MISLVVGLGNIGEKYLGTRHNSGFTALDRVAWKLKPDAARDEPLFGIARTKLADRSLYLAWPTTLMNRSGLAVAALLDRLDLNSAEMLVISDDYNLPVGKIRLRATGSAGGHNGLDSIIDEIDTDNFPRLRLGIGAPPDNTDRADFVLEKFADIELPAVERMIDNAAQAVIFAVQNRFEEAMTKFNTEPA